ncbi:MAG: Hsp20/alpha crystallin family protein [candidate division WOR-3 bacterium]|nr:Hsp20/alpha crystallin family protein [candidate division WOR-3 bacterium]
MPKKSEDKEKHSLVIRFIDDIEGIVEEFFDFPTIDTGFTFEPPVDILETDDTIYFVMEVPGVTQNDLNIAVGPSTIIVQGIKRPPDFLPAGASFYNLEIAYGNFRKRVLLPCRIETQPVRVALKNGLLMMQFRKYQKQIRTIKIE